MRLFALVSVPEGIIEVVVELAEDGEDIAVEFGEELPTAWIVTGFPGGFEKANVFKVVVVSQPAFDDGLIHLRGV